MMALGFESISFIVAAVVVVIDDAEAEPEVEEEELAFPVDEGPL